LLNQILICENERDLRDCFALSLSRTYDVIKTGTIEECVTAYQDARPGLVLMDYRLSDGTGVDALRRLNEQWPTKCVLISAYNIDPNEIKMMIKHNLIQEFIQKPISQNSLHDVIARNMGHCMVCMGATKTAREWHCTWCEGTGVFTDQAYESYKKHHCDCLTNPLCLMCHKECHCSHCLGFT
jgi:DNA-binding NtrC family response regulator